MRPQDIINRINEWQNRRKRKKAVKTLESELQDRMTRIDETMELKEVSGVYAKYVCMMNRWDGQIGDTLSAEYCEVSLAFMNGYIKALHDNGLEFRKGLVKKRDIVEDMPSGVLKYYRNDVIKETKALAVDKLRKVMNHYETSKTNIATIVRAFEKELEDAAL